MRTDELDFHLPPDLIAQVPAPDRAASRLLHYRRDNLSITHRHFADLPRLLRAGDLLVFNNARVLPARFTLQKQTGGRIEGLFLAELAPGRWQVMLKNAGPGAAGMTFVDAPEISASAARLPEPGQYALDLSTPESALQLLARVGRMPLPPYIKRDKNHDARDDMDRQRYQTIYAAEPGAVAAPTAGLHFTGSLLRELDAAGVQRTFVTLHVGLGTFKPVETDDLSAHTMHTEAYTIPPEAADAINQAKRDHRRIIAVGTTAARVLESQPPDCPIAPTQSQTSIFIYPPYTWRHTDALITNFHLPRSTLIALVAAITGLEEQRRLYSTAIQERYRFFSYGDAMLIE